MGSMGQTQKDWLNFGGSGGNAPARGLERPGTSSGNPQVKDLEEKVKQEQRTSKKLAAEVEMLKKDLHKSNFSSFTQNTSEVSVSDGRLPMVPGVREINLSDLEFGEQIGQGGFSVIMKGMLNQTPVAIKKIFDPTITDDLLQEIQNEIIMQSILRHPNIVLLMGVVPKIPNIVICFEHVSQSLF